MTALKELDRIIGEAIAYEHQLEELADIIGDVSHIDREHDPVNELEDAYTKTLVCAEMTAQKIVDVIHPGDFPDWDNYWHAVIDIRLYLANNDVDEITVEDLNRVLTYGFDPC